MWLKSDIERFHCMHRHKVRGQRSQLLLYKVLLQASVQLNLAAESFFSCCSAVSLLNRAAPRASVLYKPAADTTFRGKALIKTAALNSAATRTWLNISASTLLLHGKCLKTKIHGGGGRENVGRGRRNKKRKTKERGCNSALPGIRMYTSSRKQTEKPTVAPFAKKRRQWI